MLSNRFTEQSSLSALSEEPAGSLPQEETRLLAIEDIVNNAIARVMLLDARQTIAADRSLQELGLDSLMASALRNRLAAATGLDLPPTLLFDAPTPQALVDALRQKMSAIGGGGYGQNSSGSESRG